MSATVEHTMPVPTKTVEYRGYTLVIPEMKEFLAYKGSEKLAVTVMSGDEVLHVVPISGISVQRRAVATAVARRFCDSRLRGIRGNPLIRDDKVRPGSVRKCGDCVDYTARIHGARTTRIDYYGAGYEQ